MTLITDLAMWADDRKAGPGAAYYDRPVGEHDQALSVGLG
jgi:hypothetical protein